MMSMNASANTPNGLPRLRPLDIRHEVQNGQPCVLLRDPLQLSEQMLLIPQPWASVLVFCDGRHDAPAMANAFTERYQLPLQPATVEELLAALDQVYLLENARSAEAIERVLDEYRRAPFRTPILAGSGYPAEPEALHALLQDYLEAATAAPKPLTAWPARAGLLSPHIDYSRGGSVYAEVWKAAAEAAEAAELIVLFGTDHYGDDAFTLTRQDYATPYGVLPTEQSIVDELAAVIGEKAAFAGELRHRDEHSLELVAVWLHHMRNGKPVDIVPILTGSLRFRPQNGNHVATESTMESLLATLDEIAGDRRLLIVASGDLAHVGPAFGGEPLDTPARHNIRQADEELLDAMRMGDSQRFLDIIEGVDNRNNVCGVSPIYLTMRLVEGTGARSDGRGANSSGLIGEQFAYAECPADECYTSAVTVAGMTFAAGSSDG
jgi:AmmeMemoRadiSam system protein B